MAQPPKPPYIDGPATPTQKTSLLNTSSGRSRTYSQSFQVNKHSSGVSLRGGILTEGGAGYGTLGQRDKVGKDYNVEKGEQKGKLWSRSGYGGLRRSSTIAGGNGEGRGNKYLGTWGRRRICVLAGVLLLGTGIILSLTREDYQESKVSTTSLSSSSYDFVNQRTSTTPDKNGYIRLVTLPFTLESPVPSSAPLTPSKPKPNGTRRLILVGDVHGAFDELKTLLGKVDFDPTSGADHLVLTGDVVAKGPKSGEVLDFMNKLGEDGAGSCVRGNHDDRVLKAYERLHKIAFLAEEGEQEEDNSIEQDTEDVDSSEEIHGNTIQDMENNSQLSNKGSRRRQRKRASDDAVAKTLKYSQAKYLATCPLILRVRSAGHNGGDLLVVHAGIVPGIPLLKQNPELLMNMRTILPPKHAKDKEEVAGAGFEIGRGSSTTKGRHWASVWNEWENARVRGELGVEESSEPQVQRGLEGGKSTEKDIIAMPDEEGEIDTEVRKEKGATVVYGHYAAKGLDIRKWTKGLDSNCVRGGRLSALVVQKGAGKEEVDMQIVSVKCKKYVD